MKPYQMKVQNMIINKMDSLINIMAKSSQKREIASLGISKKQKMVQVMMNKLIQNQLSITWAITT